ncbi:MULTISPECIES: TetR family transcriptional regulator [Micrococcus]|nr:TetR family transcriptional regulator [Micrococcus luteus]MBN6827947.1 TetR family transcriptional regulator [Micrococcus luteus]MBN6844804.1 TetR family transcriptional regulator [Micrococcus luteus]MBN6861353.1 TetR family transcriptional regulator [Micrococcus luteus]MBN6863461.1 TetR family transcriptional regulator [Micrococcus luteus]
MALDVFAEHLYVGGSIRAISARAGVSHATLI